MKRIKKIRIAHTPTPIEVLKDFPHPATIFVKRDDLTGLITSGNKVRKLEYSLADALSHSADTVITCGGIQSNHCRATVACCKILGLSPLLVLRGEPIKPYDGNLLLDYLLGCEVRYISRKEYENVDEMMAEIGQELSKKGRRPYIIPEGASNEVGLLGYIDCMAEMKRFIEKERIEAIYVAVGSGGTYAGLILGKKIHKIDAEVIGIIICDTVKFFEDKILDISQTAIECYKLGVTIKRKDLNLVDGFIGRGYGIPYKDEIETIKQVAKYGIILDVVYTGKAFYGMLREAKNYKKVLFVHTGGIFSLFPYKEEFYETGS